MEIKKEMQFSTSVSSLKLKITIRQKFYVFHWFKKHAVTREENIFSHFFFPYFPQPVLIVFLV